MQPQLVSTERSLTLRLIAVASMNEKRSREMLKYPNIQRTHHRPGILAISSLLLFFSVQTFAQSGRRATKPAPGTPPQTPSESNDASPKQDVRPLSQKVSLVVGRQPTSKHLLSE